MPQLQIISLGVGIWGGGLWLGLSIIWPMVIVPLLDLVTGWQDTGHYERSEFTKEERRILDWNTRLYAIFYITLLLFVIANISLFGGMESGLLIGGMGLTAGICFGASHELLHGKSRLDQIIQKVTTAFLFYPHYKLIHIRSHHHHIEVQPYYLLGSQPNAPKLPVGYFWAIPLVFLPVFWRKLVHSRLFASAGCAVGGGGHQASASHAEMPS